MQSHMVSIHSPHNILNTIKNECQKSAMCHRGRSWSCDAEVICSLYFSWKSCIPTTAKMNRIIIKTKIRFPSAPIALIIIFINMFRVGHDFASFRTRINLEKYFWSKFSDNEWYLRCNELFGKSYYISINVLLRKSEITWKFAKQKIRWHWPIGIRVGTLSQ